MNMLLEQALQQPFREASWQTLLTEIFVNEQLDLLPQPQTLEANEDYLRSVKQLSKLRSQVKPNTFTAAT